MVYAVEFFDKVLHVDDPVGAISVHGVCGTWGTLSVGLFAQTAYGEASGVGAINGLFFGGGLHQFLTQLVGVVSVFAWVGVMAFTLFYTLKKTIGLRVSPQEEIEGLDLGEHDLASYPDFQQTTIKSYHLREM